MYRKVIPIPTLRAVLLIGLAAYLLIFPARASSDIIASGFAIASFSVCVFFFWLLTVSARNISSKLTVNLSVDKQRQYFSRTDLTAIIRLSGFKLPGFVIANLKLHSDKPGLETRIHQLNVRTATDLIISETLNFPHRGNWKIKNCSLHIFDPLGLFEIRSVEFSIDQIIEVSPEPSDTPEWIPVSSSIKEDDSLPHPTEKKGERYDFKPYHPSDGSRRIIWKLLARSGELFSRHPEPAYSPEGKMGLYCMALKTDDLLASQSVNFIQHLEEQSIEVRMSCLSDTDNIARNAVQANNNLMEHAWHSDSATELSVNSNLEKLINELAAGGSTPQSICIAISEVSLENPRYRNLVLAAGRQLASKNISTCYFISRKIKYLSSQQTSVNSKILSLFIENENPQIAAEPQEKNASFISELEKTSSQVQWSS